MIRNTRTYFMGIIALPLAAAFCLFIYNKGLHKDSEIDTLTITPSEYGSSTDSSNSIAKWTNYRSEPITDSWRITMRHPPEVQVLQEQERVISFKYIGPESLPETEITDGFIVSIVFTEARTIDEYIKSIDNKTSAITNIQFNGQSARTFQAKTELEDISTHTVFVLNENDNDSKISDAPEVVADVATNIFGDQNGAYKQTINEMLKTLVFTRATI